MKFATLRVIEARLAFRFCSMLSPVKKVTTRSASALASAGLPIAASHATSASLATTISVRAVKALLWVAMVDSLTVCGSNGHGPVLPDALDLVKTGPLLCGGITVFSPLLLHNPPSTARVGIIGIGGLGHMALQFANKWGCEVHAFTTSQTKEAEALKLGTHYVHNTRRHGELKKIAASLDLIISTINVPMDIPGLLETLAPKGILHVVGAVLEPMLIRAFGLILGQKSIAGSPGGNPTAIDRMLAFCARHSIAPVTETFPMSKVNDALEHLRAGKARYRIVLVNDHS